MRKESTIGAMASKQISLLQRGLSSLRSHPLRMVGLTVLLAAVVLAGCHSFKPMPEGLSLEAPPRPVTDLAFFADETWVDGDGVRHTRQHIFDEFFVLIDGAQRLIVADQFLFNDWQGPIPETTRALSSELVERLIARKAAVPDIQIIMITDPVNSLYGGLEAPHLDAMRGAGIDVVETNLDALRDSNTLYSPFWRLLAKPFGNSPGGVLPNPIGPGKVSLRTYLKLINFKANHRKTLIVDRGEELVAFVSSANPHDGSSAHRNAAIRFNGPAVLDLLSSENAVLALSGLAPVSAPTFAQQELTSSTTVQVVTEEKIRDAIVDILSSVERGDQVDLMMFYLSNKHVVKALLEAHAAGAQVRILLDPNKDAFGREKNGVPNRPVARKLHRAGIPVRWCDTRGEQCHAKMLVRRQAGGDATLLTGSANFTRRNLNDLNLETDVRIQATSDQPVIRDAQRYFEAAWSNEGGRIASADYEVYESNSLWQRFISMVMESTGFSTF